MNDYKNYSLLRHNTFGIEASCRRFLEYETAAEAAVAAQVIRESQLPHLVVGSGSNLLLVGSCYDGLVVHSAVRGIELVGGQSTSDEVLLRVGSGENWDDLVDYCVAHGYHGAENLSLIPGEVGASAVQNIGAYGAEAADLIYNVEAVEIATGRLVVIDAADCHYGYRQSRFKGEWSGRYLITHVVYRLSRAFVPRLDYGNIRQELERKGIGTPTAAELRSVIIDIRRRKLPDPEQLGNAGSFFMNPVVERPLFERLLADNPAMPHYHVDDDHEKIPAAWLIDQCGWKGRSLRPAGVHTEQALVLVNRGGATGQDVLRLCQAIQADVLSRFGIMLRPEVNIV